MTTTSSKPKIHLHLNAPDTTIIHRAGLLGLWMTLKQLEKLFPNPSQRVGEISWKLTPNSVSLDWNGQDKIVLDWLLKQAFKIDHRGLISLTGLNPQSMPLINKIHLHQVLTHTLLQYNKNVTPITLQYKVLGINLKKAALYLLLTLLIKLPIPWQFYLLAKGKLDSLKSLTFKLEQVQLTLSYQQLITYVNQNFSQQLCNRKTNQLIEDYIPIVSWLYPGAIVRHETIRKDNQCKETTKYAFALLFLPVACHYLILSKGIHEQIKSRKTHPIKCLLVIPDPINLEESAQIRWRLNNTKYQNLYVSSLGEAAFSYHVKELTNNFSPQRCQVILYGKLMKKSKLRNPVEIQDFKIDPKTFTTYQLANRSLPKNKLIQTEVNFLVRLNLIRGIIANNLIIQKPICKNLWLILKQQDPYREIRTQLNYNQHGLFIMIKNNEDITKAHNAFIDVIHEALKMVYAQIYQDNPEAAPKRIERENQTLKSKLLDCYKEDTFRHLMARLFSKAGNLSTLNENRTLVLPIITGKVDWKEARDIALIALSSYPTKARMNQETLVFFAFPLLIEDQLYRLAFLLL